MASQADASDLVNIRRLASSSDQVRITKTAKYDLIGLGLTKADICDEIIRWIDEGERVKAVVLRDLLAGQKAFEMKPRINNQLLYLKVTLCDLGATGEYMLLISAHVNH